MINAKALRILPICLIAMTFNSAVLAEWVDTVADAKLEIRADDNINRSAFTAEERKDDVTSALVSAGRYFQLNKDGANYTRMRLTADLEFRKHSEFDQLDRTNLGVSASLTHKFGLGANEHWVRVYANALSESVRDDTRDKEIYAFGVVLGKQYTERFGASIDASFNVQDGRNDLKAVDPTRWSAASYDLDQFVVSASGNFRVSENFLVSGFYSYLDGELNGQCSGPSLAFIKANITITALTPDRIFGGCRYRLDGSGQSYGLAGTYAINSHAAINFGVNYSEGGRQGLEYKSEQIFANFRYSH